MVFVRRFSYFLAPSVFAMVVAMIMVPVTTYVLDPAAFGVYGLMTALVAVGWTFSLVGSSAVCSMHFQMADHAARRSLVSTMLAVALVIAGLFSLACLAAWPFVVRTLDGYASVPRLALLLSLAAVMLGVPWMVAQEIITLDGRARGFAAITMAQTLVGAVVTVLGLYVFELGVVALFLSACASAATTLAGSLKLLAPYLTHRLSRGWAMELARVGPASIWSSLADALQAAVERGYLASVLGVGALGLYVHAQNYRVIIAQVLKAAARPIWPVTLVEARDGTGSFRQTRLVWDTMYLTVAAAGVTFAVFGREIIGWLTHGRFVDAAVLVPYLMMFLLVQNAGKPQVAVLYRDALVRTYYWIQVAANLAWLACLFAAVAFFGLVGGVLALIGQQLIIRLGVHVLARDRGAPFSDAWLLSSVALIAATMALASQLPHTLFVNALLWIGGMAVLIARGAGVLRRFATEHLPRLAPRTAA